MPSAKLVHAGQTVAVARFETVTDFTHDHRALAVAQLPVQAMAVDRGVTVGRIKRVTVEHTDLRVNRLVWLPKQTSAKRWHIKRRPRVDRVHRDEFRPTEGRVEERAGRVERGELFVRKKQTGPEAE